jgi:hypothetical protein
MAQVAAAFNFQLIGASVESVAENASDSVVAPLLYYLLFGLLGAVVYRVVNTLDAMVGYHGRYEYLGKASARLDDVLNFVPARLTALLGLMDGGLLRSDVCPGHCRVVRVDGARVSLDDDHWPGELERPLSGGAWSEVAEEHISAAPCANGISGGKWTPFLAGTTRNSAYPPSLWCPIIWPVRQYCSRPAMQ